MLCGSGLVGRVQPALQNFKVRQNLFTVTPAKAGVQRLSLIRQRHWIPAFAGMTTLTVMRILLAFLPHAFTTPRGFHPPYKILTSTQSPKQSLRHRLCTVTLHRVFYSVL